MELPVAKESYQPSSEALVRAVKRAAAVYARTSAAEQTLDCGVAFCHPDRPSVPSLNFISDFKLAAGQTLADALAEVDDHFRGSGGRCLALQGAAAQWPADMVPALAAAGYQAVQRAVLILRYYRPPTAGGDDGLQVIPARASYGELRALLAAMAGELAAPADAHAWADAQLDSLDEARLEMFLARLGGRAVAIAGVLSLGQIGVLYPVWVEPAHRRRGIGTRLLHHVLEHCQRATFEQVLLERPTGDPAAGWCDKLGFAPVATFTDYRRGA